MKKIYLSEEALENLIVKVYKTLKEQDSEEFEYMDDEEEEQETDSIISKLKEIIESDDEITEDIIDDIYDYSGPKRRFRGSIYIDEMVPETDDKEFDRAVGKKLLEFYSRKLGTENYVGGLGFRNPGNLLEPYDNMDF